ncbi:stalk domain-containing protein [Paenibacillus algorifonticola]|uniref:stalk domain-containing protein n=1 Tax=Paenibacillus algorifonticola TaxID=684063 RepID=UPI003D266ADA
MKIKKMILLFMVFIMFAEGLESWTGTASAYNPLEYRQNDYLVNILEDGDGQNRVFKFETPNIITASNTKLRLFINAREIEPEEYTIDYNNYAITINKAPDPGAELSIKYLIIPTFEWGEGISGGSYIGNALSYGDGSTKVFKLTTKYMINSSKKVILRIGGRQVPNSEFTFNHENYTITLLEKRRAPLAEEEIYFYIPKTSITGTQTSPGGTIEEPISGGTTVSPPSGETGESPVSGGAGSTGTEAEPEFQLLGGESYPGSITLNKNYTLTVKITIQAKQPAYTSYLMIKNASGEVVKRIRVKAGSTSTYSLKKIGLPSGGYYVYLKTINQSGGLAASLPIFVPINNEVKHIKVFISGYMQAYAQAPVNTNGNVLVPFRSIFESLGAKVEWDSTTQTVTATKEGKTIVLTIGSNIAYVNGVAITLSAAPQLINGTTMVPVRFVSEALGGLVEWNVAANSVVVFQSEPTISTTVESEKEAESDATSSSPILTKISKGITAPTDIVFVIDVTGSMGGVIDYIKETVKSFVDSVPAGSNFAIVAYRDINYVDQNKNLEFYSFTNNKNELKTNLDQLKAAGGGDEPESGLDAIHMAMNKLSGRTNAKRIIFITDASVHDKGTAPAKSGFTLKQVIAELKTNKVVLDAIAPKSGSAYKQIIQLVNSNKGKLYDIDDASTLLLNK